MKSKAGKTLNQLGRSLTSAVLLALVFTSGSIDTRAQVTRPSPPQPDYRSPAQPSGDPGTPPTTVLISPDEDYLLGPGDIIDVQVEDAPELSRTFRIAANGTFPMPFIGRVMAQRKTSDELATGIADRLRGEYLVEPNVIITVKQINSHAFFIQGAVRRPGVYQIEGRPSLLKLITVAGGLADNYGSTAYIIREAKPQNSNFPASDTAAAAPQGEQAAPPAESQAEAGENYELLKINIGGLLKGRFDQNMTIDPGSIVNIPPSDVFFVAGEVKAPGSFPLKEGTTLRQAISLAQGTTFEANKSGGIIFREDTTTGRRQEIKIDVGKVMSGKQDDVPIVANDIIILPNSRLKSVGSALLTAFGVSAVRLPNRY